MLSQIKHEFHNLVSDQRFSEILTGSVWALSARVLATAMAMASSIIIARSYGAEMMGIVAVITSFMNLTTIFTVLGTNTSVLRLIPEHLAKYSVISAFRVYRKTQYFVASVSVLSGSLLFLASPLVAQNVFSKPNLTFYLALTSIFVWAKSLMDLNTQAVRGLRMIRTFSFMQVVSPMTMLLLLLTATLLPRNTNAPVYAQLSAWSVTAILGACIIHATCRRKSTPGAVVHSTSIRRIVELSFPMLLTASMAFLIGHTGTLMLGMFRTVEEVGYYSAAIKLSNLTLLVLTAINSMAAPRFSELFHAGRTDELFHVARKSTKLIFWTTAPILLCLILLGTFVLRSFFGEEFTQAYPALILLAIGQFVNSISGATGHFMNMTGDEKPLRNIMIAAASLNVLLNLVAIPPLGIYGAALSAMLSLSLSNIGALIYIRRKYGRTIGYLPRIRSRPG